MKIKIMKGCSFLKKGLLINIMRIFLIFFCTTVFGLTPNSILSQNAKVSIEQDKVMTVDEVFNLIMEQTDYSFVYQVDMFLNSPKVPLKKGSIKVNTLLEKSLLNGNFIVDVNKNNIIIKKSNSIVKPQEQIVITGVVTGKDGMPLPGITVVVTDKEPKSLNSSTDFFVRGTATDFDGNFTIKAEVGNYIAASGIGYDFYSQKVSSNNTTLNIVLTEKASELDEVVLVGYGTKTRGEVSSAISSVKSAEIAKNVIGQASFDRSLAGLVKGVNVKASSGAPGDGVDINIRGYTSPFFGGSNSNPLFVIDGVPFQASPTQNRNDETRFAQVQNPLLAIHPDDIESMDVLKDAAATAIYGSRGANGVIIVNTKKGKRGEKAKISYSSSITMSEPIKTEKYLNATEWRDHLDGYFTNSFNAVSSGVVTIGSLFAFSDMININPDLTYGGLKDDYFGTADTNWNDEVYRSSAHTKTHNLSISGGSEKTAYSFSGGFMDQEGLLKNDNFNRYNLRLALDTKLSNVFSLGTNLNLSYSKRNNGIARGNGADVGVDLNARPDVPAFDENRNPSRIVGSFFGFPSTSANPYAITSLGSNSTNAYNILGNIFLNTNITDHLTAKIDVNGSFLMTDSYVFSPKSIVGSEVPTLGRVATSEGSTGTDSEAINTNLTTDLTLNYNNNFGKHNVGGLIGYSWSRTNREASYSFLQGFPDDFILTNQSSANSSFTNGSIIESGLNSVFGRASYNYDSKYYISLSLRSDKSSKFGHLNREAFFPAVSASWNIAKENFLDESKIINNLKLRASVGETGSNNVSDFVFFQGFERGFRERGFYAGNSAVGISDNLANPSIGWETTKEFNLGLDYGFLKNRLRGSIDVYDRKTEGALVRVPPALEVGSSNFTDNFVDLSNKGFELEIGGDILVAKDFKWSTNLNVSKNGNKVLNLTEELNTGIPGLFEVGKEIGLIRGYQVEGIYQNQAEIDALNANAPGGTYSTLGKVIPGDYKYKDINGDNQLTVEDRYGILGSSQADFFGGFNSNISYKGFELSAFFNFSKGAELTQLTEVFSFVYEGNINPSPRNNIPKRFTENRWSPANTSATLPNLLYRGPGDINSLQSSATVYDASYIRLRNIQIAYNLPSTVLESIGVSNASIFLSGSNLVTWTNFPGLDPENGSAASAGSSALGGSKYPNSKSWSMGINVNF